MTPRLKVAERIPPPDNARPIKPFLTEGFVSNDLLNCLIVKVIKSTLMNESLQQFVLQEIVNFMTFEKEE